MAITDDDAPAQSGSPFLAAGKKNLTRDEAQARSAAVQVLDYDVAVDLSDAAAEGATLYPVTTRIRFTAESPQTATFLDYLGDSVESVVLNDEHLDTDRHVGTARILLPDLLKDNVVEIRSTSRYSRSGEGLHRFVDPSDDRVYLYTQYEPADSRRVFPVFEQPDLKAVFRFSITGPETWELRSNGAEISREAVTGQAAGLDDVGLVRVAFAETRPMSSYITALAAGPYHRVDGSWIQGVEEAGDEGALDIPLAVMCRASLAQHLDAEVLLELTRRGLDFFHAEFAYDYPWGKYDQILVPEYNLGAMENPGLVTFTEKYVFDTAATDAQHETRANTLMHEMAHMWFGDLVTMQWWDDLWLKESFADYMGSLAVDEATDWTTSWISFANGRKAWAYVQDQLPTTHPIVADIVDLEAADQNFDGITYAKGASVLKQLAAFVGRDAFREATRRYFRRHAFGNATLQDFLTVLGEVSGQDMSLWARTWLQTAGVPVLAAEFIPSDDAAPEVIVTQSGVDPATGQQVARPHVVEVAVHALDPHTGTLRLSDSVPATLSVDARHDGVVGRTAISTLTTPDPGTPRILLPNENDLTYAKLHLDEASVTAALSHPLEDPLARATIWAALWSMVRDGDLTSARFIEAVVDLGTRIEEVAVFQALLRQSDRALELHTPGELRDELQDRFAARLVEFIAQEDGGDRQRAAARVLAIISRRTSAQLDLLATLLDGEAASVGITGLDIDEELRWAFLQALTVHGRADQASLDAELGRHRTARGRIAHRLAVAARPQAQVKRQVFSQAISGLDEHGQELSNDHLTATVDGFRCGPDALISAYDEDYFEALEGVWMRMTQGQATRVIEGLFPGTQDLPADMSPDEHPTVRQTAQWLADHAEAPLALRRILIEEQDHLLRSLGNQRSGRGRAAPCCPR